MPAGSSRILGRTMTALAALLLTTTAAFSAEHQQSVVYEGSGGIGAGKHIVFIASDHEYRGEETLPALARILAKHHGFKCTVIFGIDPADGTLKPGSSYLRGLEVLKEADLMVLFMRFINMDDDEQMQHFVDYVDRGGPIIGLRTSTHAFNIPEGSKYYRYHFRYPGEEYHMGFGRQVLGETWVTHYGKNHQQSSILAVEQENKEHPILRGVRKMHTQAGGYTADPIEGSTILARGIILDGMEKDAPVDMSKELMPVVWVRDYASKSGKTARIFCTTQGASQDIVNKGFRRMLVNAHLWCLGMEEEIGNKTMVDFVGEYHPSEFSFDHARHGLKPADAEGWDKPIYDASLPVSVKKDE
jgi:hypothetical protein